MSLHGRCSAAAKTSKRLHDLKALPLFHAFGEHALEVLLDPTTLRIKNIGHGVILYEHLGLTDLDSLDRWQPVPQGMVTSRRDEDAIEQPSCQNVTPAWQRHLAQ